MVNWHVGEEAGLYKGEWLQQLVQKILRFQDPAPVLAGQDNRLGDPLLALHLTGVGRAP